MAQARTPLILSLLLVSTLAGVLTAMLIRNTYTDVRLLSIALSYAISIGWILLIAMTAYILARRFWTGDRAFISAATLFLVVILKGDPYASGRIGGDANAQPVHLWQIAATGVSLLLLFLAAALLLKGRRKTALSAYGLDLGIFLLVNAHLVYRDGPARFYSGYEWTPTPLVIMIAGCLVRLTIVYRLFSALRASGEEKTTVSGNQHPSFP